jgi:hypothetical protein
MFAITYMPGRRIAVPDLFQTREAAEQYLSSISPEFAGMLHIVETDGEIWKGPEFEREAGFVHGV